MENVSGLPHRSDRRITHSPASPTGSEEARQSFNTRLREGVAGPSQREEILLESMSPGQVARLITPGEQQLSNVVEPSGQIADYHPPMSHEAIEVIVQHANREGEALTRHMELQSPTGVDSPDLEAQTDHPSAAVLQKDLMSGAATLSKRINQHRNIGPNPERLADILTRARRLGVKGAENIPDNLLKEFYVDGMNFTDKQYSDHLKLINNVGMAQPIAGSVINAVNYIGAPLAASFSGAKGPGVSLGVGLASVILGSIVFVSYAQTSIVVTMDEFKAQNTVRLSSSKDYVTDRFSVQERSDDVTAKSTDLINKKAEIHEYLQVLGINLDEVVSLQEPPENAMPYALGRDEVDHIVGLLKQYVELDEQFHEAAQKFVATTDQNRFKDVGHEGQIKWRAGRAVLSTIGTLLGVKQPGVAGLQGKVTETGHLEGELSPVHVIIMTALLFAVTAIGQHVAAGSDDTKKLNLGDKILMNSDDSFIKTEGLARLKEGKALRTEDINVEAFGKRLSYPGDRSLGMMSTYLNKVIEVETSLCERSGASTTPILQQAGERLVQIKSKDVSALVQSNSGGALDHIDDELRFIAYRAEKNPVAGFTKKDSQISALITEKRQKKDFKWQAGNRAPVQFAFPGGTAWTTTIPRAVSAGLSGGSHVPVYAGSVLSLYAAAAAYFAAASQGHVQSLKDIQRDLGDNGSLVKLFKDGFFSIPGKYKKEGVARETGRVIGEIRDDSDADALVNAGKTIRPYEPPSQPGPSNS